MTAREPKVAGIAVFALAVAVLSTDTRAGASGKIEYSLQHFRLGMVFTP